MDGGEPFVRLTRGKGTCEAHWFFGLEVSGGERDFIRRDRRVFGFG